MGSATERQMCRICKHVHFPWEDHIWDDPGYGDAPEEGFEKSASEDTAPDVNRFDKRAWMKAYMVGYRRRQKAKKGKP